MNVQIPFYTVIYFEYYLSELAITLPLNSIKLLT